MKGKDSNRTQIYEKSRRTLSSIRAAASELKLSDIPPRGKALVDHKFVRAQAPVKS